MKLKINRLSLNIKRFITLLFFMVFLLFSLSKFVFASNNNLELQSKSVILVENKTNKILYDKNANDRMFPASTTKIVTAILVLEHCNLNDVVTADADSISSIPEGYVTANITADEQLTVEQLLELLLVHSANDSANILAKYVAGSIDNFVSMMNEKANDLELKNTHFTNTYGLQDPNHYTTAQDLSVIMQYCLKNDDFRRISAMSSCSIPPTNKSGIRNYVATNKLLVQDDSSYYKYATAGKTGFTTEAGDCLVSCAFKNDIELICVVLGGSTIDGISSRFSDSKILYEYGFNNFSIRNIVNSGDILTQIQVSNASLNTKSLDLAFDSSLNTLVNNADLNTNYVPEIILNDNISAPITKGTVLGKAIYNIDGNSYTLNLIAAHDVAPTNIVNFVSAIIITMIMLVGTYLIFFTNKKSSENE